MDMSDTVSVLLLAASLFCLQFIIRRCSTCKARSRLVTCCLMHAKGFWDKRTSLEKVCVFLVSLLIIVVVALAVVLRLKVEEYDIAIKGNQKQKTDTPTDHETMSMGAGHCMSSDCVTAAAEINRKIDYSVKPCNDFYAFACGKWRRETILPENMQSFGTFNILDEKVSVTLKYLLEEEIKEDEAEAIKKSRRFYKSCMNETLIDERGISPAFALLQELGGWPVIGYSMGGNWNDSNFNLTKLLVTLKKYNYSPIIGMFVYINDKNSTRRIIYLDQPYFVMPGRKYYLRGRNDTMVLAYEKLFKLIAMVFGADEDVATQDARDMVDFETELANISMAAEERRDSEKLYNLITIRQLPVNFTESSMLKFSWSNYLMGIMAIDGVNVTVTLTEDTEIVIWAVPYFKKIISVLEKYSHRTIANYAVWRIMKDNVNYLGKQFKDILSDYYKVLSGVESRTARWRDCTMETNYIMGLAVGRLYVEETFDKQAKLDMLDMITQLKSSFDDILQELDWMDDPTRKVAKEKADAIIEKIGYENMILNDTALDLFYIRDSYDEGQYFENILNYHKAVAIGGLNSLDKTVNKTTWYGAPAIVNAYYSPSRNMIIFPAGILQPPFYSKNHPKSLNYGAIGVIIGHEITHGFDDQGRQFDKDGNLNDWWNITIIERFREKSKCIIEQYGNFTVPEAGMNINGINTQGENIADNGGIKQSFRAYRNWIKARGKEEPKLPGLDFTNNQLFFLNYANIWCSNMRKENAVNRVLSGVHSPAEFRVKGTLQNSEDFAREFNCPVGSFMNPSQKCNVW